MPDVNVTVLLKGRIGNRGGHLNAGRCVGAHAVLTLKLELAPVCKAGLISFSNHSTDSGYQNLERALLGVCALDAVIHHLALSQGRATAGASQIQNPSNTRIVCMGYHDQLSLVDCD